MSTNNNEQEKKEKQALREKAINKEETQGKKINQQVNQRKNQHEPRDNA